MTGGASQGRGKVVIVGAGIGGLAAAIGMSRIGYEVRVLERRKSLDEVGAGISLWPNALRALDLLGVGATVRSAALADVESGIRAPDGRWLARLDLAEMSRRFGPLIVLHRRDLMAALFEAIPTDVVQFGAEVTAVREMNSCVAVSYSGGHETANLLIGADGVRSVIRRLLWPDASPPRYAGYTAWRFVTAASSPSSSSETWGKAERFGYAALPKGLVYAFAAARAPASDGRDACQLAELSERFAAWHAPIPDLIASARESDVLRNDIEELPSLPTYVRGRAVLIGDAAHAMSPNLGQGACQALEDAVTLPMLIKEARAPAAALSAYDLTRKPRTQMVARRSAQLGRIAQWRHWPLVTLRNGLLRSAPNSIRLRSLEPIVGWQPPEGPGVITS